MRGKEGGGGVVRGKGVGVKGWGLRDGVKGVGCEEVKKAGVGRQGWREGEVTLNIKLDLEVFAKFFCDSNSRFSFAGPASYQLLRSLNTLTLSSSSLIL